LDAVLKRELPQGPGWLRYNWDGYGETADGGPFEGWGQGRVWPLMTGERAHYELAAARDISGLICTYERFATPGQMLPEQVWDDGDMPERDLIAGLPAGSATPLVWAHAEYLKLLRSTLDGKVFDRVDPVYERYCSHGRQAPRNLEIYSLRRPIQRVNAGDTLRILDGDRFELVWTADGWKTTHTAQSRAIGSAAFSVDVETGPDAGQISLTLHWPDNHPNDTDLSSGTPADAGRWLGYNVNVEIVSE
jgi:glucoamylase